MKITASRGAVVAAFTVRPTMRSSCSPPAEISSGWTPKRSRPRVGTPPGCGSPGWRPARRWCRRTGARGRDRDRRGHLRPMGERGRRHRAGDGRRDPQRAAVAARAAGPTQAGRPRPRPVASRRAAGTAPRRGARSRPAGAAGRGRAPLPPDHPPGRPLVGAEDLGVLLHLRHGRHDGGAGRALGRSPTPPA